MVRRPKETTRQLEKKDCDWSNLCYEDWKRVNHPHFSGHAESGDSAASHVPVKDEEIGNGRFATTQGFQDILAEHTANYRTDRRELVFGSICQGPRQKIPG